jgi:hypothetical protein
VNGAARQRLRGLSQAFADPFPDGRSYPIPAAGPERRRHRRLRWLVYLRVASLTRNPMRRQAVKRSHNPEDGVQSMPKKPVDPREVYERGLADPSSLRGTERMVFAFVEFENLMDREGWGHFFIYEHHFAWYAELKEWPGRIGDIDSLAVLEDFEAFVRRHGAQISSEPSFGLSMAAVKTPSGNVPIGGAAMQRLLGLAGTKSPHTWRVRASGC